MDGRELSSAELVKFAEEAGRHLGWASRYLDLVATVVGAVFRACGVDETSGRIAVTPEAVAEQADAIYAASHTSERSARTVSTYQTTWKRLARIAHEWTLAQAEGREEAFWTDIGRFKDQRVRRRTSARASGTRRSWASDDKSRDSEEGERDRASELGPGQRSHLVVELSDGPVSLDLPDPLSHADAIALTQAILGRASYPSHR